MDFEKNSETMIQPDTNFSETSVSSGSLHLDSEPKVVYIFDEKLADATNCIPHLHERAEMVHELIGAYNLLEKMEIRESVSATEDDILTFHSNTYVEFLSNAFETSSDNVDDADEFGLGYDCPTFSNMMEFACRITGATLTAVQSLMTGSKIAINWCGGWHHGQRNEASGFCYVNDIVIGIQYLLKEFKKVLYVDLDAHHGDGVENAFSYSNKVMTMSLHNFEVGYFPGTGNIHDIGFGRGKYYSVNIPIQSGIIDEQFTFVFDEAFSIVQETFSPDVIVVQCGTDCLTGDPLGNFNLSEKGLVHCVQAILKIEKPTLFLGGGGYHLPNAAKAWTTLTATILGETLSNEIPENKHFLKYGPDFTLPITAGLRINENSTFDLEHIIKIVKG